MPTKLTPDNQMKRILANKLFGWKTSAWDNGDGKGQFLSVSKDGCTGDGCYEYWEPLTNIQTAWEIVAHFQVKRDDHDNGAWVNFSNALRGSMLYTMTEEEACRAICVAALDTVKLCQPK